MIGPGNKALKRQSNSCLRGVFSPINEARINQTIGLTISASCKNEKQGCHEVCKHLIYLGR